MQAVAGRQSITIMFDHEHIEFGWPAFHALVKIMSATRGDLVYRWHYEAFGGITANFEVVKTP